MTLQGTYAILGATGAVGSSLARRLTARGAGVVLLGRDQELLAALGADLGAPTVALAESSPSAVAAAIERAAGSGKLAGIAHCVGTLLLKPARATSDDEWAATIEANLTTAFGVAKAAPQVVDKGGSVVFVSSVAARLGLPNHEAIAAAKAGVEGLARAVAASNLRRGIRCNCVAPALVQSRMTAAMLARPGMLDTCNQRNPSGRIGEADDVARTIEFLLDPAQSWLNGQVVGIDGGFGSLQGN
ncbi:MAG: 3-oxoacyl-[acyl-carrier-protein] reductase FabG [Planctomycetota bacterium]